MTSFSLLLFALDSLLYLVCVFAFALLWHVSLFKPTYDALGWKTPDSSAVALGFATIGVQAVVLAFAFQWFGNQDNLVQYVVIFSTFAFVYLWSSHVLGDAAKLPLTSKSGFIALESTYLVIQFVAYGIGLWAIHSLAAG